jgi:F-type H+-transporting ATPase subunit a
VCLAVSGCREILVEMKNNQGIVHGDRSFIAPLALTVFVWVALMNSLISCLSIVLRFVFLLGVEHIFTHHRVVPTADLNGTLGISLGVLALMLYYSVKIKGLGGFLHELVSAPFGIKMAI